MPEVLSREGVPILTDFAGGKGTPLVVDTSNAQCYVMVDGNRIVNITSFVFNTSAFSSIQAAIDEAVFAGGGIVFVPPGTHLCQGLTVADNSKVTIVGCGASSILQKNANGPIITLGKQCQMSGLYLDGQGGTYSGVGIVISSGANEVTSWRHIDNCDIQDTLSYAIEFSGQRAGFGSTISKCRMRPLTLTVAAIKLPTVGSNESNGNRSILGCISYSNSLCEVADGENTQITGCDGGVPTMNSSSAKLALTGCRLVNWTGAATWTIQGTGHSVTGNNISLNAGTNSVTFSSNCVGVQFKDNYIPGATFIDNAGGLANGNDIFYGSVSYTPTWTADGTAPDLGDGSISGAYWREGQFLRVNIRLVAGATTTFGTGASHFSVPLTAARATTGSALLLDSGTALYGATSAIAASASTIEVYGYNVGNANTNTIPFTWASGDTVTLDIRYPIT
jgi:hypothetical protein